MSERLARLAMLAYPRSVREAQGEEILDTLRDVSGESQGLQLRESVALIRAGLQRPHQRGERSRKPAAGL